MGTNHSQAHEDPVVCSLPRVRKLTKAGTASLLVLRKDAVPKGAPVKLCKE